MLIDAGADTTAAVRVTNVAGAVYFCGTTLAYASQCLREKNVQGKEATDEELHKLEAVRHLLLRIEAVHRSLGCGTPTPALPSA